MHVKVTEHWSFIDLLLSSTLICLVTAFTSCIIPLSQFISFCTNMSQRFSTADVAAHKTADDLYIIVDEDVYDLTKFADEHPGGKKSMVS